MMSSSKPYLIRAIHQWIVDNELTPYLVVNANYAGVQVPNEYIEDGRIVLNISPKASRGLHLANDRIVFSARFSGVAVQIFVPPQSVLAIYAKENGRGMVFNDDESDEEPPLPPTDTTPPSATGSGSKSGGKPQLKIIK